MSILDANNGYLRAGFDDESGDLKLFDASGKSLTGDSGLAFSKTDPTTGQPVIVDTEGNLYELGSGLNSITSTARMKLLPGAGLFSANGVLTLTTPLNIASFPVPCDVYLTGASGLNEGLHSASITSANTVVINGNPSTNAGAYASTTRECNVLTSRIPGGKMGTKGKYAVEYLCSSTANTSEKAIQISFGLKQIANIAWNAASTYGYRNKTEVQNSDSESVQIVKSASKGSANFGEIGSGIQRLFVNTSKDVIVSVNLRLATPSNSNVSLDMFSDDIVNYTKERNLSISKHNKTITSELFGQDMLYYPGPWNPAPTVTYGIVRSHDWRRDNVNINNLIKWCNIETSDGVFDWTSTDSFVNHHKSAGRKIIIVPDGTPSFHVASPVGAGGPYLNAAGNQIAGSNMPPDDLSKYERFITALANRYQTDIIIELWNEPQFEGGSTGYWIGTATQLAAMMRVAYSAIKAVNPSIQVISPSCTAVIDRVRKLLFASDGAGGVGADHFDILGYHFYNVPYTGSINMTSSVSQAGNLKAILTETSRPNREIWNTESGVESESGSTGGLFWLSGPTRAAYVGRFFALRWALGIYTNIWYAYDSSSMGLLSPAGGATPGSVYDLRSAWESFYSATIGKTLISSTIEFVESGVGEIRLEFSDGTIITV